jgi:Ni2+-binding GTPase involved in maturation of urease and hydrogenase
MPTTKLILVGGFLGAGKSTLVAQAARRLAAQGKRVGLVANDQAPDLVDTAFLKDTGSEVEEVAGGCFCCRFPDMIGAMERLVRQANTDVLIGEPVGSCTDLSATVLQPLKRLHAGQFDLAPFSVLVDVHQVRVLDRLRQTAGQEVARFPENVLYIYEKQLEEADLIVLNKADLLSAAELAELQRSLAERFPGTPLLAISALNGEGVEQWLDFLSQPRPVGQRIAEVDYDTYAAGEAALGWLNLSADLRARADVDWEGFARGLLTRIQQEMRIASAEIAHLKLFLTTADGHLVGNVTNNEESPSLRGGIAGSMRNAALLVNARVHAQPEQLRAVVEHCLHAATGDNMEVTIKNVRSFFPGRPEPTYRFRHNN